MRCLFIGSVEYSAYCLRAMLEMNVNIVDIMCPDKEASKLNNDYVDLSSVAGDFGKKVYYFERIRDEESYIREQKPDVIFVLGLSQIIPKSILEIPNIGCIGSHPALLPQNRGRHPIIWAIANGLTRSGITLFWIDEGVDSGDIWAQREFEITEYDDALSVYNKINFISVELLKENIPELSSGVLKRIRQDDSKANYWRKRTKIDGGIDWRMSCKRIYDLVRALRKPYVGAHCIYNGTEVKIWRVNMFNGNNHINNLEPGKVLSVTDRGILVKTGDGAVEIEEHNFNPVPKVGEYL